MGLNELNATARFCLRVSISGQQIENQQRRHSSSLPVGRHRDIRDVRLLGGEPQTRIPNEVALRASDDVVTRTLAHLIEFAVEHIVGPRLRMAGIFDLADAAPKVSSAHRLDDDRVGVLASEESFDDAHDSDILVDQLILASGARR